MRTFLYIFALFITFAASFSAITQNSMRDDSTGAAAAFVGFVFYAGILSVLYFT